MTDTPTVWKELDRIVKSLSLTRETDHFIIRYDARNQRGGKGNGAFGIRYPQLLDVYSGSLEALHGFITAKPYGRDSLTAHGRQKGLVYIFDLADWPFSGGYPGLSAYPDGSPFIMLPSRTSEPTRDAELATAAAAAVHEATHLFNYRQKDFYHPMIDSWRWLDESLAVQMESLLLPNNLEYLRFGLRWTDDPHLPLDDPAMWYDSTFFVRYVDKRMGDGFAGRAWMEAEDNETAVEALNRLLRSRRTDLSRIFQEYCRDSFLHGDPKSSAHFPKLFERYGDRAVRETFTVAHGEQISWADSLDHLPVRTTDYI